MIEIKNLTKQFGSIRAVDDVTFSVEQGEVLGFLGPNGAGKSTTMKMITGFLPPTSGTAIVCGHDVLKNPIPAKSSIGYLPEGAPLYPDMTPAKFLGFIAEVRGLQSSTRDARINEIVARVHIDTVLNQRIDTLSKGFKRRVGLAQAILHDPPVLILDEPTDGLDPNQKREMRALIQEMSKQKVIVLSTHILEEVDAVCTRAIIINNGRVVADGSPVSLLQRSRRHNAVAVTVKSDQSDQAQKELTDVSGVQSVEVSETRDGLVSYIVYPAEQRAILTDVADRLRKARVDVNEIRVETGRLDEVFRDLTSEDVRVPEGEGSGKVLQ